MPWKCPYVLWGARHCARAVDRPGAQGASFSRSWCRPTAASPRPLPAEVRHLPPAEQCPCTHPCPQSQSEKWRSYVTGLGHTGQDCFWTGDVSCVMLNQLSVSRGTKHFSVGSQYMLVGSKAFSSFPGEFQVQVCKSGSRTHSGTSLCHNFLKQRWTLSSRACVAEWE